MRLIIKRSFLFVILAYVIFSALNISWYLIIYELYDYNGSLSAVREGELLFLSVIYLYGHKEMIFGLLGLATFLLAYLIQVFRFKKKNT